MIFFLGDFFLSPLLGMKGLKERPTKNHSQLLVDMTLVLIVFLVSTYNHPEYREKDISLHLHFTFFCNCKS